MIKVMMKKNRKIYLCCVYNIKSSYSTLPIFIIRKHMLGHAGLNITLSMDMMYICSTMLVMVVVLVAVLGMKQQLISAMDV